MYPYGRSASFAPTAPYGAPLSGAPATFGANTVFGGAAAAPSPYGVAAAPMGAAPMMGGVSFSNALSVAPSSFSQPMGGGVSMAPGGMGSFSGGMTASPFVNKNNDTQVNINLSDSIACMRWRGDGQLLAVGTWGNELSVVGINGQLMKTVPHQAPVLCCDWSPDGVKLFSAGGDKIARVYDVNAQTSTNFGQHDAPIKELYFCAGTAGFVATLGWDSMLKYWDLRQPSPIGQFNCGSKVLGADYVNGLLAIVCADKRVFIMRMDNPQQPVNAVQLSKPFNFALRCIRLFPDCQGFVAGGVDGRCTINNFVPERARTHDLNFRCHREKVDQKTKVYAVNDVAFHKAPNAPSSNTFATCGADGSVHFWDKETKSRAHQLQPVGVPITRCAFDPTGQVFAYCAGYDWSRGAQGYVPGSYLLFHRVQPQELVGKPVDNKNARRR